jgi:hypothetical protein
MKVRNLNLSGFAIAGSLVLIGATALDPADTQAGILRDIMVSAGLSKPKPATATEAAARGLPRRGFACCNLHYKHDWINDANYAELPMISVGTPMEVQSYGKDRAYVTIDGRPMRLGHDYGRDQESLQAWVEKIVVTTDPKPRLASWPKPIQDAIYEGKIVIGMTRDQAIASVGYPLTSENVSLNQPTWRVWRSSQGEYDLNWRQDGRLGSVTGNEEVTKLMLFQPAH